jgi:hypothetical protein
MTSLLRPQTKHAPIRYVYIGETANCGLGIFASKTFRRGEILFAVEDTAYFTNARPFEELLKLGYKSDDLFQIGHDSFIPPSGNIDDYTNHSCNPNTGIRLTSTGFLVLALRNIPVGEEITYDYSTYLNNPYETMVCRCQADCRGIVGSFWALPEDLRRKYLDLDVVGHFASDPTGDSHIRQRAAAGGSKN